MVLSWVAILSCRSTQTVRRRTMRIRKISAAVVVLAAISATVSSAVTRAEAFGVRAAGIVAQLEAQPRLVAAAREAAMSPDQPRGNAVSKIDKNSFTLIGNVFFYNSDV